MKTRLFRYIQFEVTQIGWMAQSLLIILIIISIFLWFSAPAYAEERLLIFAGAAGKPPTEELAKIFAQKTGIKIDLVFGGSGFVLSQMILAKKGDIYFPGSSDFMELAKKKGAVYPETEKRILYLVPAINVQKGNPKGLKSLLDLTKPGVHVAIANPAGVCVGLYAVEIIEKNFNPREKAAFRKNLVNYTESCEKTATAISLKAVDAIIGWSVFRYWAPDKIETIPLKRQEIARIGYIPVAVSKFTGNRPLARKFIDFLQSGEAAAIFKKKYHYFMTPDEASNWIGEKKPVGGEYFLPPEWMNR